MKFYLQGNFSAAEDKLRKAVAFGYEGIDGRTFYLPACLGLGLVYAAQGEIEKADEAYKKALSGRSADEEELHVVYYNLGNLHLNAGQYEKAKKWYSKICLRRKNPIGGFKYYFLPQTLKKTLTREDLNFLRSKHIYKRAYNNLGTIEYQQQNYPLALKYFKKSLEIDPEYHRALYGVGLIYQIEKNYSEAIKFLKKAEKNGSKNACYLLGVVYYHSKKPKKAEEYLKKYLAFKLNTRWEIEAEKLLKKIKENK
jgi:tetratricopeptide (TPR) repeat protein